MCVDGEYETASRVSQVLKYGCEYTNGLVIVGKLHQNVTKGNENVGRWIPCGDGM